MELLVFSDSHGWTEGMQAALRAQIRRPTLILHLGDCASDTEALQAQGIPVLCVRGNCDWASFAAGYSEEVCFEELGHKILMTHGHRYGVKSGLGGLITHAATLGADIVLFGHTHVPYEECIPAGETVGATVLTRPMYLLNPGSIGKNWEGGSFGTVSLTKDTVLLSHGQIGK